MIRKQFILLSFLLLEIASLAALPLRGFSTNAFLYDFPGQKFNADYVVKVQELQPEILRFPGGTIANKYHFFKPGYGQNSIYDKKVKFNYIEEFIRLVKSISPQPKVLYVVNIFEHFYGIPSDKDLLIENLSAITYLQKNGIDIYGVELGNELMIYPAFQDWQKGFLKNIFGWKKTIDGIEIGPKTYKYYQLCLIYHHAIKKINPNIKTGIPLGSDYNKKHRPWNEAVKQLTFPDAFICHAYGNTEKNDKEILASEAIDNYLLRFEKQITQIRNQTQKEIWITEWNGINFGFKSNQNKIWKQTDFHRRCNLKFQEMFNRLGLEVTTYHRISGNPKGDTYNLINVSNGKVSSSKNYDAFLLPPYKNKPEQ